MHRSGVAVALSLVVALLASVSIGGEVTKARADFGFASVGSSFAEGGEVPAALAAGSHPDSWTITLALNSNEAPQLLPDGELRNLRIELPAGVAGAPALLSRCARADLIADLCPASSRLGTVDLQTALHEFEDPLYLLEPTPGVAVQLAASPEGVPVTFDLRIDPDPPHRMIVESTYATQAAGLVAATLVLDQAPEDAPFLTLPRSCDSPLVTEFAATRWGAPNTWVSAVPPEPQAVIGCSSLGYAPDLHLRPTAAAAGAPSGLQVELDAPDPGIESSVGRAAADTRSARLVFPDGMTLNPSTARGLAACSPTELADEAPDSNPETGCPERAKVGTGLVSTPLLDEVLTGELYLAEPDDPATAAAGAENPFDGLIALYLVLRDPARGVLLRLPIRVDADPLTGRLTASMAEIPELPLSHVGLHLNSGGRAPLVTPSACGDHAIGYSLSPSSGARPLEGIRTFETRGGCAQGFAPQLSAGTVSRAAGRAATFVVELAAASATPNLSDFELRLPPGLTADLTTATTCPEEGAASASCPPGSRLGYARIALGAGPEPLWVPGEAEPDSDVYLAGAYRGAPFSLVVSVPAVAGPFDLGRVVLRAPVRIDPDTAQLSVELDGLPQIRDGIPLSYRVIRLVLDRPGLVRNPTSCAPMGFELTATAETGATATAGERFQAADCGALRFRPRLAVRLSGAVGRNGHPRVSLRLLSKPGQANLAAATFDLPPGELLDPRHIRALCARDLPPARCPASARLGKAALHSPLLPGRLRGPVFLRAPGGRYPDLLADLHGGGVHVRVHGTTASARGGRLRIQLRGLPDIPLSEASIVLAGGRRGIVVNSASLCSRSPRAAALLRGHNGREFRMRPHVRLKGGC